MNHTTQGWFDNGARNLDRVTTPSDFNPRPKNDLNSKAQKGFTSHEILVGGDNNDQIRSSEPSAGYYPAPESKLGANDVEVMAIN